MSSFVDTAGRRWSITVTVATLRRIRQSTDIDLLKVIDADSDLADRIANDPVLLVDVLAAALAPQLAARGITADELAEAMDEGTVVDAAFALIEALADFFRGEKAELIKQALREARREAERREAEALQQMARHLASPGDSSGSVPESSASTPNPSPSPN